MTDCGLEGMGEGRGESHECCGLPVDQASRPREFRAPASHVIDISRDLYIFLRMAPRMGSLGTQGAVVRGRLEGHQVARWWEGFAHGLGVGMGRSMRSHQTPNSTNLCELGLEPRHAGILLFLVVCLFFSWGPLPVLGSLESSKVPVAIPLPLHCS